MPANGNQRTDGFGPTIGGERGFVVSSYFDIQKVSDGVYAAIVKPGTGTQGNAGIVDLGDATVVFDTFLTPDAAQALRETAEHLTGNTIKYVVNSHRHADHVCGNQVFSDAIIISTDRTRERMRKAYKTILSDSYVPVLSSHIDDLKTQRDRATDEKLVAALTAEITDNQAFQSQMARMVLRLSALTFNNTLRLYGSHRMVELITLGGGHTDSDVFMVLPEDRVAFMGDLVTVRAHPSIISGNVKEWLRILGQIQTLDITTVVPGHGAVGTMDDVKATGRYLSDLLAIGNEASDVVNIKIPQPYSGWMMPHVFEWNLSCLRGVS